MLRAPFLNERSKRYFKETPKSLPLSADLPHEQAPGLALGERGRAPQTLQVRTGCLEASTTSLPAPFQGATGGAGLGVASGSL